VRGAVGTVLELQGRYPLPDDRARRLPADPEPVYTVRFAAVDLFGDGGHTVTVDLWECYLRPAAPAEAG
jgi:nitrile hydratase